MTKRIEVPEELIKKVELYLETHNLANRGKEDGNKRKQMIGLIGEIIAYEYLTGLNYDFKPEGFDGGVDFIYKNKRIDVKTKERKSFVKPHYDNTLYGLQKDYNVDILVFCSYNSINKILEICGWIEKEDLFVKSDYYPAGSQRARDDGSILTYRQDNYVIQNENLNSIILLKIKNYD